MEPNTSASNATSAEPMMPRIELRGVERSFTMSDTASFKIAHVMRVRGPVDELVRHAPAALVQTFNKHPRMRGKQARDAFAAVDIHPHLTLADVATHKLVVATDVSSDTMHDNDSRWHQFVQTEVHKAFDRYTQFPFYVRLWVDSARGCARIFLFADHYLSDGVSGYTILHDVLSFASAQSLTASVLSTRHEELPLYASLYNRVTGAHTLLSPLLRFAMTLFAKPILKRVVACVPVLAPRADQADFSIPPPTNPSTVLFASGSKANLDALLAQCRAEHTTFFGALTAAVFTAYAVAMDLRGGQPLTVGVEAAINMRARVSEPVDAATVGCYANPSEMETLSSARIDVASMAFWDLARAAKREVNELITGSIGMALSMIMMDTQLTSRSDAAFFRDIPMAHAGIGDACISSIGKYPHALTHAFNGPHEAHTTTRLHVETLHCTSRTPYFGPFAQFYVTAVHSVGYGCNHHLDNDVGKRLFETLVAVMEHAGSIERTATLADVMHQVSPKAAAPSTAPAPAIA